MRVTTARRRRSRCCGRCRATAANNPYVLDDFLANDQAATGHGEAAAPLFAATVKGNPYIAGYYKDLGDFLRFSFEPDAAHGYATISAVRCPADRTPLSFRR